MATVSFVGKVASGMGVWIGGLLLTAIAFPGAGEMPSVLGPRSVRTVPLDVEDLAVRQDSGVEVHGLLGLTLEHEDGGDGGHGSSAMGDCLRHCEGGRRFALRARDD